MIDVLHPRNDQSTISRYAYGYDDAGRRTWVLRANGRGDVYRYDATDQLTNVLYEALNPHSSPTGWTNEARYAFDPRPATPRFSSRVAFGLQLVRLDGSPRILVSWCHGGWKLRLGDAHEDSTGKGRLRDRAVAPRNCRVL